jgi:hypothetical protein
MFCARPELARNCERQWPSFQHHATLCIPFMAFLILERETIPSLRTSLVHSAL